ncbi:MAG: hypothetical protein LIO77_03615, partial [Rikenellaceae bacterium]|nr:hypothetical protein [Rikenellaceae bacterium]
MEKKINRILDRGLIALVGCLSLFVVACADEKGDGAEGGTLEVGSVQLTIGDSQGEIPAGATRAVSGFVVNTDADPTYLFNRKLDWILDLTIFKNGTPYAEGLGQFEWDGSYWTANSTAPVYMPNYLMQEVAADLYPAGWGGTIATDQRNEDVFVKQDILRQNGSPTYTTAPAHYLEVEMRHGHSMIDFVLDEVNPDDIASVTVEAGGDTYQPYHVPMTSRQEYLVILPLAVTNPVIRVSTNAGANYSKELEIASTAINTCYYVRLTGLELILQAVTVSNWSYGEAVAANYSSVTSYPAFMGPEGVTVTIYYDNGLDQTITFNDRGVAVERPAGRTIIAVETTDGRYDLPTPYTIRD